MRNLCINRPISSYKKKSNDSLRNTIANTEDQTSRVSQDTSLVSQDNDGIYLQNLCARPAGVAGGMSIPSSINDRVETETQYEVNTCFTAEDIVIEFGSFLYGSK